MPIIIYKNTSGAKLRNLLAVLSVLSLIATVLPAQGQLLKKQNGDFTELADPTADTLSDWSKVPHGLHASFVSVDRRYPKSILPTVTKTSQTKVIGWKGEKVSAQILLWTRENIEDVQVDFGNFRSGKGAIISQNAARARFVRYVMTDEFGKGCGKRSLDEYPASLSPDMLDNLDRFQLEKNKARPVWVTIEIPRSTPAGLYRSQVQISGKKIKPMTLDLDLEVIDQTLPPPSEWGFHLDQWQHPSAIARVAQVPVWSNEHFDAMIPVMQLLADAGQKVITTTLNKDPWNIQTFDPYEDMIKWTKGEDGKWTYDYTVFDRWVTFMMQLGINKMINCYSIIPWNNEIHYMDASSGKLVNVKADPGTAIFNELWGNFFDDFKKHLTKKGWLSITNIAMDERDQKSMDAAFRLIDSIAPELGMSFADNKKTYQRYPKSKDISISSLKPFSHDDLVKRRAAGLNTTFYVYCATPFPNQFTFSEPGESTYLAWYALAADFDGFLRWAFNSWVEKPMEDSRFRTWPAGDTYIVYPDGRSSIRYERMLEGIQDYEKVQLLKKMLSAQGDQTSLTKLANAIQKLNNNQRTATWNEDLNAAKDLVNQLSRQQIHNQ